MTDSLSDAIDRILAEREAIIARLEAARDRCLSAVAELQAVMGEIDDKRTQMAISTAIDDIDAAASNELTNGAIPAAEAWRDRAAEDARGERDEAIVQARMP